MLKNTRIPMDKDYIEALGTAVYSFAYYEWTIIYIFENLKNGYVGIYSRNKTPKTLGKVFKDFEELIVGNNDAILINCKDTFRELIDERNALIHGHPCTSKDGKQVLNYQASTDKKIHDLQWDIDKLNSFVKKNNDAEIIAADSLQRFYKPINGGKYGTN